MKKFPPLSFYKHEGDIPVTVVPDHWDPKPLREQPPPWIVSNRNIGLQVMFGHDQGKQVFGFIPIAIPEGM
jgi:hypothetical protein